MNTEQAKRSSLNYASPPSGESNVDLIPFLYKDNLGGQASSLFNSPYQLTNSNPGHMFSQNIAYIQPNSLAPFQPNILLLATPDQLVGSNQMRNDSQQSALVIEQKQQQNLTIPIVNGTVQSVAVQSNPQINAEVSNSTFDVSQVSDNPDELAQENVQNHEPVENVPVSAVHPIEESNSSSSIDTSVANSSTAINDLINNATISISSIQAVEPVVSQPIELKNANIVNELTLIDPFRTNLVKRLYSHPVVSFNQIRPKNLNTNRSHRSLSIDMPSYASLITAAAAQSGHSTRDRNLMFTRFLNENLN